MANSDVNSGVALPRGALLLAERDNVAVAIAPLRAGDVVNVDGRTITLLQGVGVGAKIAIEPLRAGEKIYKYAAPIGSAKRDIAVGEHVHTHNLQSDYIPTFARGEHADQQD